MEKEYKLVQKFQKEYQSLRDIIQFKGEQIQQNANILNTLKLNNSEIKQSLDGIYQDRLQLIEDNDYLKGHLYDYKKFNGSSKRKNK